MCAIMPQFIYTKTLVPGVALAGKYSMLFSVGSFLLGLAGDRHALPAWIAQARTV